MDLDFVEPWPVAPKCRRTPKKVDDEGLEYHQKTAENLHFADQRCNIVGKPDIPEHFLKLPDPRSAHLKPLPAAIDERGLKGWLDACPVPLTEPDRAALYAIVNRAAAGHLGCPQDSRDTSPF
jgi:hypothetical protein